MVMQRYCMKTTQKPHESQLIFAVYPTTQDALPFCWLLCNCAVQDGNAPSSPAWQAGILLLNYRTKQEQKNLKRSRSLQWISIPTELVVSSCLFANNCAELVFTDKIEYLNSSKQIFWKTNFPLPCSCRLEQVRCSFIVLLDVLMHTTYKLIQVVFSFVAHFEIHIHMKTVRQWKILSAC